MRLDVKLAPVQQHPVGGSSWELKLQILPEKLYDSQLAETSAIILKTQNVPRPAAHPSGRTGVRDGRRPF